MAKKPSDVADALRELIYRNLVLVYVDYAQESRDACKRRGETVEEMLADSMAEQILFFLNHPDARKPPK